VAAALSCRSGILPRDLDVGMIQAELIESGAVLMYFRDAGTGDPDFRLLQKAAVRGFFGEDDWTARLDEPLDPGTAARWIKLASAEIDPTAVLGLSRRELLRRLLE